MSLYLPGTLGQSDLDILAAPYFGGEFAVLFSHTPAKIIGSIEMSAAAAGTYTDNAATTLTSGSNLQLVATTPLRSSVNCVVTFAVKNNAGTPAVTTGIATFATPAWVADQSHNFQRGIATDLICTAGANATEKTFTEITSLTSIAGGAANVKFDLYELPALTDYALIGCTSDITFNDRGRAAKGIDCGMETDAFVKRGKSNPGELSIGSKFKGFAQGLSRFSGDKVTAMLIGIKEGQVTGDRLVFTNYVPTIETRLPDGEGEAMADSKGKYQELLMFPAPYA
jgi:hypothetical protein